MHAEMLQKTIRLTALIAAAILTTSCAPTAVPDTRAAAEAAIQSLDERWSAIAAKNDLEGTLAFYAADAVLLPPNAPIANSRNLIRESWAALLGPNTAVSWKASKVEAAKSGELGYLYGTYQLSIKDPKGGPSITDTGKILEVWKKQPDGQWKCIADTYNSDIPVPAIPAVKK
jgi:ketosteroid isomerase-like protein